MEPIRMQEAMGPLLGRAAHLVRERMDARLGQFDITPAQTHVLLYLHFHGGGAMQKDVVEYLKVKPSTANGILDRMEEKGLLARTVCDRDARHRRLTLTEKGAELQVLLQETMEESEALMVQHLNEAEVEVLQMLLHRVIRNLEEDRGL